MAKKLFVNDLKLKHIRYCEISDIELKRHFYIVYHKDTLFTPHFREFIRICHLTWDKEAAI